MCSQRFALAPEKWLALVFTDGTKVAAAACGFFAPSLFGLPFCLLPSAAAAPSAPPTFLPALASFF